MKIEQKNPALILAPMEGVTDAPMRKMMTERGGFTFCVTEFFRISESIPSIGAFKKHIPELKNKNSTTDIGTPVQIQLLGGDPDKMAESALHAYLAGAKCIDINFGCPAPTVNRNDGGATLLKHPKRIFDILDTIRKTLPKHIPLSAKLRLGWDNINDIHLNSDMATKAGIDWITIHARTRMQGYQPPVFWRKIGEVKKNLSIPVIANGDIWTYEDFLKCRDITECSHYMIGRPALADPSLPLVIAHELNCINKFPIDLELSWQKILERFSTICAAESDSLNYRIKRSKQWLKMISHRYPAEWIDLAKRQDSLDAIFEIIKDKTCGQAINDKSKIDSNFSLKNF